MTLDDPTGLIDVTVFERVQPRCARTIFHSWMLLVKGVVRKRGGASMTHEMDPHNVGITVVAEEVFDLDELDQDRRNGRSLRDALDRQRARSTRPLIDGTNRSTPSRLWHASGGSAGR